MTKFGLSAMAVVIFMGTVGFGCTSSQPPEELQELRERIARLEAKEAVLSTFNQYLYSMDSGLGHDQILAVFCEDAILDVPNFPGAGGDDLHFEGRDDIAPLYANYSARGPRIGGGHHTSNLAVNVHQDLAKADVTAYFMTSGAGGVQGGRYEGVMRNEGEQNWCWETFTITSAWGFRSNDYTIISEPVSADYSPNGGHHAAYQPR